MEAALTRETIEDRLQELIGEFRWRLKHIDGPMNEAELEEMENEFNDIIELTRKVATGDAKQAY